MTKVTAKKQNGEKGKRVLIIFIAAFLALALVLGATLGIIAIVKNARAVVAYEGVTMEKDVAAFFISRFKVDYISALRQSGVQNAADTDGFWSSEYEGSTHGENFEKLAVQYLKEITVMNYLFDRYSSLDSDDKRIIETTTREVLEYQANGSEDEFNAEAEKYGFDYDSFCDAVKMLYKSSMAFSVIYGSDGMGVAYNSSDCEKYLSEYSHVQLIFVRTEQKLTTDSEGNDVVVDLTDSEKAEKEEIVATLRAAIEARENGADGQITPEMFEIYLNDHNDGDAAMTATGYYFHESAETTAEFAEAFPTVVEAALSMEVNSFKEVKTSIINEEERLGFEGYCFIYKYAPVSGAYASSALELWFSDFYSDAAIALFSDAVTTLIVDAEAKKKLDELNIISIPANTTFVPRFEL